MLINTIAGAGDNKNYPNYLKESYFISLKALRLTRIPFSNDSIHVLKRNNSIIFTMNAQFYALN